jgi:hypothetical protein
MFQRKAKTHSAAATDNSGHVDIRKVLKFIEKAQYDLESEGETEAAFRFEMVATFIREDVMSGAKPFEYTSKALGL